MSARVPPEAEPGAECRPLRKRVSGWGRYPAAETDLYRPERLRSLRATLGCAGSVLARGYGRSYGDACFNSAGATVLMERLNRFLSFDRDSGILDCEAGVSFVDLLDHFVPRGFFPPVTPGTKFVTLGGALACDVHGKNHHVDGSFSRHVLDFDLLTANGAVRRCSRTENAGLFHATVGGMGLTGIVTRMRLQLRRVETSYVSVEYERAADLDDALARLASRDQDFTYSVAWIDLLAGGRSLGRSVLMLGNHAPAESVRAAGRRDPLRGPGGQRFRVPIDAPEPLLNRHTVRAFNTLRYRTYPAAARGRLVHFEPYFYPLDGIGAWNRLYGRRGFVQYQFVLPAESAPSGLAQALAVLSRSRASALLAVLKRLGPAEDGSMLAFPRSGYTLALDLPWRGDRTEAVLRSLDSVVLAGGGRVYLAKDARLHAGAVRDMYPELGSWRDIRSDVDPHDRFSSDLGRRLGLVA